MTKITISGFPGAGKTTVGKILAEKFGYELCSTGCLRRKMAQEMGMTIQEFNELGETENWTDKKVDDYQKEFGEKEDNFIVEGRLGFYFIPDSIKIFLDVKKDVGAERILNEERDSEQKVKTLEEMIKMNSERVLSDKRRYKEQYGIDCYDKTHYDTIIDTSEKTPEEVAKEIVTFLDKDL